MTNPDIAAVAAGLTKAEREAVLVLGEDVKLGSDIDYEAGVTLFDKGLISSILAAGHHFTNLTDFGQQVRAFLTTDEQAMKEAEHG